MADPVRDGGSKADEVEGEEMTGTRDTLRGRKPSAGKLRRVDSLQMEAGKVSSIRSHGVQVGWAATLHLAFQSIGVVYGDIGTSPLYVYESTFTKGIKDEDDILGVLSLIMYTLILSPLVKYCFIVLWANDQGNGGTFALYSLISRYANVNLIPNQQAEDAMLSNYKLETPSSQLKRAQWIKGKLESSKTAKLVLFIVTILGVAMVIGDGILTPCISVLSAVSGIKQKASSLSEGTIAIVSIFILIVIFSVQRFGTDKVGYAFAPIILLWFFFIGGIGMYNLCAHGVGVLRAFNPKYIIDYFKRNGKEGWLSLGGVVLCITGTEAMFADLGHFNVKAIQISFSTILLPSVSLSYMGQAAFLTKFPQDVSETFYKSIPGPLFWPTFVVAVAAAIIASQAMISGAFQILSQSQALGCFPRVKVVHTSAKYEGQVYIPEINMVMMIACVLVTGGFRTTANIGNAYGIAVMTTEFITTSMVTLIMLLIWKTSIWRIALFYTVFATVELTYLSSVLSKFVEGGFLPVLFSLVLMLIMSIWHYVHVKRYKYELANKVSSSYIRDLAQKQNLTRLPGIGLLYSELVEGIPPIFAHFVETIPSIHSVLVFVSVKRIPISTVEAQERFLFRQVEPKEYRMFRCVVRYGYQDKVEEPREFESLLIEQLQGFIHQEFLFLDSQQTKPSSRMAAEEASIRASNKPGSSAVHIEETLAQQNAPRLSSGSIQPVGVDSQSTNSSGRNIVGQIQGVEEEKQFIQKEKEKGVVYLLGETEVVAANNSSILKRVTVNYVYSFMRKNFRQSQDVLSIPRRRLLKVGMTYEI
ncbi:potassium transporter 5-like [Iris pallida]|uniref:Potassium transporter n=1 Tax=Iris pallida TaxID=29817 RepID=A0AAX6EA48_IRIPA|nr:potassium transporter 5-like [Iris pallida]